MQTYTPNMLSTYIDCPQKYYFNFVKHVSMPHLEQDFIVGKNIHALAAYYLRGQDISMFSLTDYEKSLWKKLESFDYLRMKCVKVEDNVMCKVDNFWIGGRVDAVVRDDDLNYYILDYKTGKIPTNALHSPQTMIYLLACDSLFQEYNSLNFVYICVKDSTEQVIEYTDILRVEYINRIKELVEHINRDAFMVLRHSAKCSKCSYRKICV